MNFQRVRRYLSPEEKVDVAGLHLKRQMEAGIPLEPQHLYIGGPQLELLVGDLGITT